MRDNVGIPEIEAGGLSVSNTNTSHGGVSTLTHFIDITQPTTYYIEHYANEGPNGSITRGGRAVGGGINEVYTVVTVLKLNI
jgi:hypothetical protein